jgi:phage tail sheath gpL-like
MGFNLLNTSILYPLTQIAVDNSNAGNTAPSLGTLIVAQTLTAQPFAIVPVFSLSQAQNLFGSSAYITRMWTDYYANDNIGPIYCLPVADPSAGAYATGSVTISVTGAVGAGTIALYIAGDLVQVPVAAAATAPQIATSMVSAIGATLGLSVTAAIDPTHNYQVDLTAVHKGLLGNNIDLRVNYYGPTGGQTLPTGVALAITAMSGGTGTPTLTNLASTVGFSTNYAAIVHPFSDSTDMPVFAAMMNASTGRWAPTQKAWGHCWTARQDTAVNLTAYGVTNDDPHSTVLGYETGSPTPPWRAAAMYAGASMPSIRSQPNLPLQTLQMVGFMAPNSSGASGTETAWTSNEWQTLLGKGIAVAFYDGAGNAYIKRAVTTYQTNAYGVPDQSYLDTEQMYLLSAINTYLGSYITTNWGRVLQVADGTPIAPGIPSISPSTAKAAMIACYQDMQVLGWVDNLSLFIAGLVVQADPTNSGMMDILFDPDTVQGLRQVGVVNQFTKFIAAAAANANATSTLVA